MSRAMSGRRACEQCEHDALMGTSDRTLITPLLRQCFVTATVCINVVGNGCGFGFPAVLLPALQQPPLQLNTEQQSWIASVVSMTILVGDVLMPPIMGRLGRKTGHFVVLVPVIAAWATLLAANSFEALLIGRMLQGLSYGLILPLRSVLIGEYTSPKYRGAFLAIISFAQGFGIFFVHLVGSLLTWRQTATICLIFPLISFAMTLFLPESPSWLGDKGRFEQCRNNFRWLRGDEENRELEELIAARIEYKTSNIRNPNFFKHLFVILQKKEFYKPITLMIHVSILVYVAGSMTMAVYATKIIRLIMGPDVSANFWMVALDTQRIISNAVAIYMIHKVKRRTMMFSTGVLCVGAHLAIIGYTYARAQGALQYDAIWIPALLLNLQILAVATGMTPLPNVLAGEVFPLEYRSVAGSISSAVVSVFMFVIVKTFPTVVDSIQIYGAYAIYASFLTYGLLVIWVMLPETKGRTLQQIEDEYKGIRRNLEMDDTREIAAGRIGRS